MIRYGDPIDPHARVEAWLLFIEQAILRQGFEAGFIRLKGEIHKDLVDAIEDMLKENKFRFRREIRFDGQILPVVRTDRNGDAWFVVEGDVPCKHHFRQEYMSKNEFCQFCGAKPGPDDYVSRPRS